MPDADAPPESPAADPAGGLRLQVAGARGRDVGKGVARLGEAAFRRLGLEPGDPIEIVGKKRTAAVAIPLAGEDEGLDIVRLDGLQRANAGVGSGDRVGVRPAHPTVARRVTVAPAQQNVRLSGNPEALKKTLAGRPAGGRRHRPPPSVYRRRGGDEDGPDIPEEILRRMFNAPSYGLQEIRLNVTGTKPRGDIVVVGDETEVELLPTFVDPEEARASHITYDDVGGLSGVLDQVREMIELPLKHPELFQRLGIDPPKGRAITRPPGHRQDAAGPARSPGSATPTSSTSPAPKFSAAGSGRANRGCGNCSTAREKTAPRSFSSTRSTPSPPSGSRSAGRWKNASSPNSSP